MNREEFCKIITDIRKRSSIKMKDICFQMGVMPTAVYRLEKGSSNFEMGNMMSYIKSPTPYSCNQKRTAFISYKMTRKN